MPVDAELLDLLACPSQDHAALRLEMRGTDEALVCTHCGSAFPIRDGIPVLLIDEAIPGPNGLGQPAG
jgi:uncharacterized protein